ncbi:MAG: hypothetical protein AAF532_07895 [Planctomycetota bacterium]
MPGEPTSDPFPTPRPRARIPYAAVFRGVRSLADQVAWAVALAACLPGLFRDVSAGTVLASARQTSVGAAAFEVVWACGCFFVFCRYAALKQSGGDATLAAAGRFVCRRARTYVTTCCWACLPTTVVLLPGGLLSMAGFAGADSFGTTAAVVRDVGLVFLGTAAIGGVVATTLGWAAVGIVGGDGLAVATRVWAWSVRRPDLLGLCLLIGFGVAAGTGWLSSTVCGLAETTGSVTLVAAIGLATTSATAIVAWSATVWTALVLREDEDGIPFDEIAEH